MSRPKYPAPAPGVFRHLQSATEEYLFCGERWELSQKTQHRRSTVKMVLGSGVGVGAEADNREKLAKGIGLSVNQIIEAAVTGYEHESEEAEVLESKLEQAQGKDDTANAARVYGLQVSPLVEEVIAAEEPIVASLGESVEIAGTPDLIDSVGLGDLKTGRAWTQEYADRSRQLTMYGMLHLARLGSLPKRLWIDNVYHTAKGWKAQRIYTHRAPYDYKTMLLILERVREGISAGVRLPPPELGSWRCSKAYCPFFGRECQFTKGQNGNA